MSFQPKLPPTPNAGPPRITLYTAGTPNGRKATIALEVLRAAYPDKKELAYEYVAVDLSKNEQKSAEFLKINPNGRIPALTDNNAGGQRVFETGAILLWLADQYDTEHKISFADKGKHAEMVSWMFWANSGLSPMMGQIGYFSRQDPVLPGAVKRFVVESRRLFTVLEDGLADGNYLVGNQLSLADLNAFTWVRLAGNLGIDPYAYPRVGAWIDRIQNVPGVETGLSLPVPFVPPTAEAVKAKVADFDALIAKA